MNEWLDKTSAAQGSETIFLKTLKEPSKAKFSNQNLETDLLSPNKLKNLSKRHLNLLSIILW